MFMSVLYALAELENVKENLFRYFNVSAQSLHLYQS